MRTPAERGYRLSILAESGQSDLEALPAQVRRRLPVPDSQAGARCAVEPMNSSPKPSSATPCAAIYAGLA